MEITKGVNVQKRSIKVKLFSEGIFRKMQALRSGPKEINKKLWNSKFLPTKGSVRRKCAKVVINQSYCSDAAKIHSQQVRKDAVGNKGLSCWPAGWLARAGNARVLAALELPRDSYR